jgi:hypothetical protein
MIVEWEVKVIFTTVTAPKWEIFMPCADEISSLWKLVCHSAIPTKMHYGLFSFSG